MKTDFRGRCGDEPYEIAVPGANEHWNDEADETWPRRLCAQWPDHLWINPTSRQHWDYTRSTGMVGTILGPDRMVPMTLEDLTRGMRTLA